MISHRTTDIEELIEHYLLRDLTPEQEVEWEAHYFECKECCRRLERMQTLKEGVARMPAPAMEPPAIASSRSRWEGLGFWSPPRLAFAFAVVVAALAPTAVLLNQVQRLNGELSRARLPMAVAGHLVLQEGVRGEEAVAELSEDAGSALLVQFSLPRPPNDEAPVDVTIVARASGRILWRGAGVRPIGPYGVFAILCPSDVLSSGVYNVLVTQGSGSTSSDTARFEFRVKRP